MSMGLEILGTAFGFLGFILAVVTCALPMWKVTDFMGANIKNVVSFWHGLWMDCVTRSTGQLECMIYDSKQTVSADLQASRAMMIISIILGGLGIIISIVGSKCTNCIKDKASKAKVVRICGIFFIIAGLLILIPLSWCSSIIVQSSYNSKLVNLQNIDIGASLYIGWGAAALLLIRGAMLCSHCLTKERYNEHERAHSALCNTSVGARYDKIDCVEGSVKLV